MYRSNEVISKHSIKQQVKMAQRIKTVFLKNMRNVIKQNNKAECDDLKTSKGTFDCASKDRCLEMFGLPGNQHGSTADHSLLVSHQMFNLFLCG